MFLEAGFDGAGFVGGNRRGHHHGGTGLELGRQRIVAEQHRLALRRVDDQQQDGVELVRETGGIGCRFHGAGLFQLGTGGLVQVDTIGLKAGPDAGLRSPHAHGAKPDDADVESAD